MDGRWRIELADTARNHGYVRMDAIAAISRARFEANPFEASRVPGTPDPAGWIGPAIDGTELEVFAEVYEAERRVWIFHIMKARSHIIRKIGNAQNERTER